MAVGIGTNYSSRNSSGGLRRGVGAYDALLSDRSSAPLTDRGPRGRLTPNDMRCLTERTGERRDGPYGSGQPLHFQAANDHAQGGSTGSQQRTSSADLQLGRGTQIPDSKRCHGGFHIPTPQQPSRTRSVSPGPDNPSTQTMLGHDLPSSPGPDTLTMLGHDTQNMVRQLTEHPVKCGLVLQESPSSRDVGTLSTSTNLAEARIQQLRSDAEKIRRRSLSSSNSADANDFAGVDGAVNEQRVVQTVSESLLANLRMQEEALHLENQELQKQVTSMETEISKAHQVTSQREHEAAALSKRADMIEEDLKCMVLRLKTQEEHCRSKDAEARARRAEVARLSEQLETAKGDLSRQSAGRQLS